MTTGQARPGTLPIAPAAAVSKVPLVGVLFRVTKAVPAIAHRGFGMGAVLAFWFAYVLTRPVGASFADRVGVPPARHGLGWGTGSVSLTLAAAIALLIGYLAVTGRDDPGRAR